MQSVISHALVASLVVLVLSAPVFGQTPPRPPGCPATKSIVPFVCVSPLPNPGDSRTSGETDNLFYGADENGGRFFATQLVAYFGYINTCDGPITAPVGLNNFFSPGIVFRGAGGL